MELILTFLALYLIIGFIIVYADSKIKNEINFNMKTVTLFDVLKWPKTLYSFFLKESNK